MHKTVILVFLVAFIFTVALPFAACAYDRPERKPAIVLAAFGTTDEEAVESIFHIVDRVEAAFPEYDVHLAFTSNTVRRIWRERAGDAGYRAENPSVPEKVYGIRSPLATLGDVQEEGARLVLVQSLHVTDGHEYTDLASLVDALANIRTGKRSLHPFPWIGVGEPALGTGDGQAAYLERAAVALANLVGEADARRSALVLMGHGNEHLNQKVFARLEETMRRKYGPHIYIGTVEAAPFAEDIAAAMRKDGSATGRILLAPLMVVAGDHARNDMAGDEGDSWATVFTQNGFEVECRLVGLGSENSWADIYVEHLKALEKTVLAEKASEINEDADEDGK